MNNNFDPSNAIAVSDNNQGTHPADTGNFNVDNAVPVDVDSQGNTAWDSFKQAPEVVEPKATVDQVGEPKSTQQASEAPLKPNKGQSKSNEQLPAMNPVLKDGQQQLDPNNIQSTGDYPDEGSLNKFVVDPAILISNKLEKGLVEPFTGKKAQDQDAVDRLSAKHPIEDVISGSSTWITTAPLFPEGLAQFAVLPALDVIGRYRTGESKGNFIADLAKEEAINLTLGRAFQASESQAINAIKQPFMRYLAKVGIISGVNTAMHTMYGDNIAQSFKDGSLMGALAHIGELPHLASTALGRGVIAHVNDIVSQQEKAWTERQKKLQESRDNWQPGKTPFSETEVKSMKFNLPSPILNADSSNKEKLSDDVHKVLENLSNDVKDMHNPKIVAATIKLPDGTEIHGTSHDDALSKIGENKDTIREYNEPKEVSFELKPNSHSIKNVKNKEGKIVGDVVWGMDRDNPTHVSSEGIDIDVDKTYGDGTIKKVFDSGVDVIRGDVAKGNNNAIKFWTRIGGKLTPDGNTAYKLYLTKDDFNKSISKENKYIAGFTVLNPDGTTKFISREESKQEPYNLPTGHSEEVKGLNESKFMTPPNDLKITNPDTLKFIKNNQGKMHVNMLLGVPEVAEVLQKSHEELKEKFTPYEIGNEGKIAAETIRENLGVMHRNLDRMDASLHSASKLFDRADNDSSLDFIYRMEEGSKQQNNDLQKISDVVRNILDKNRDEVIGLGTGKLEHWIENYFPHAWEDPKKVSNFIKRLIGKRPFEGTKSFLKKRTIPTTREGVELGLTPVTYNPIDSVMLKVREMQKYVMAHRTIQALKEQGIIQFVRTGEKSPDGFVPIDDRFAQVTYKNAAKELVLAGKYVSQRDAARILNNYLSPGLAGKSYIYDLYRGAGNTLNQFQLGISAFHLGFTSMDATISKFSLGINKLSTGDYAGGLKEFSKAPFAPITNILQGRQLLQSWYGKDNGELTNTIADLMASAGGRAKMDKFYATGMKDSMMKSIKEGKIATAVFKVPFYIVEQVARPIMEYIVPRQKMGVFMDMMKMEMERNPGMSHQEMRSVAQRAWNSVDNRMGQLVYDNLFWNRTTKDLAMASVRSLGWNLGTVREIGGGLKDVVGNVNDVIHGKATQMSYRTAYVMALPIVTGLYGAIYQYLHTGKGPQELKDYFFPKNGAVDNKGQEARVSLPTYMKDVYHYTTNPVQTVIDKFSPVNNAVMEMLANKDYYGVQIRNADDPMQQILDESGFLASQFAPFGFRNQSRDTRTSLGSKIEPFIGIVPAPYDINMTAAEKEAYELEEGKIRVGSRTKEQAKHSNDKAKLRSDYMANRDRGPIDQAVDDEVISSKEAKQIIKESNMTNLQRMTQHLTFEEVLHVMKKATPAEKDELEAILEKKKEGKESRGTWSDEEENFYAKTFKSTE